jgi:hypothetical protein
LFSRALQRVPTFVFAKRINFNLFPPTGAWALVVGHSSLLLVALLLPDAAVCGCCAVALLKKANQPTLAAALAKQLAKLGLLDASASPYWKVKGVLISFRVIILPFLFPIFFQTYNY